MNNSDAYRKRAAELRLEAASEISAPRQEDLERLAQRYVQIADEADDAYRREHPLH